MHKGGLFIVSDMGIIAGRLDQLLLPQLVSICPSLAPVTPQCTASAVKVQDTAVYLLALFCFVSLFFVMI